MVKARKTPIRLAAHYLRFMVSPDTTSILGSIYIGLFGLIVVSVLLGIALIWAKGVLRNR